MKTEEQRRNDNSRQRRRRDKDREAYNSYMRECRAKNKDRINARYRELRKLNVEKYREQGKRRYHKNPLKAKLRKYKITESDYYAILETQNSVCAICNQEMMVVNIDHCHSTGKVRGLLCTSCNTGIGKLKDNVKILQSAIEYLTIND